MGWGPAIWLAKSWFEPAYNSNGHVIFALVAGLLIWSATSKLKSDQPSSSKQWAVALLILSGLVRLISQVFAINTIGALCLAIDVYALGLLLRLGERTRPISPFWLSLAFLFCLPLERILQRTLGYGLQHLSADAACGILKAGFDNVLCEGVRIVLDGVDVLIDLPCSGAQTLLLALLGFAIAAALARPSLAYAAIGVALTLLSAAAANVLRIVVLAIGISNPDAFGGLNVMQQPWHDLIGLGALTLVCLALILWIRASWRPALSAHSAGPKRYRVWEKALTAHGLTLPLALMSLALAAIIISLPRTAVDVARAETPFVLPASLEGHARRGDQLSEREKLFFTQFGGTAAKASYGPHGLLLIRTSSPLRHLHAPDECLRGMGFKVEYVGAQFVSFPTAIYNATSPTGDRYRIDVSFVSDAGDVTTNVAAAVWRWMDGKASSWTAIQRISPEGIPEAQHARFTRAVVAAFDLPTHNLKGTFP